jgi:fused signal recognition particle receptor
MLSFLKSDAKPGASWGQRLKQGLARTRELLNTDLTDLFSGSTIDELFYEELETTLLAADVGVAATGFLVDELRAAARRGNFREPQQLKGALRAALLALLKPIAVPLDVSAHKPLSSCWPASTAPARPRRSARLPSITSSKASRCCSPPGDTFRAAAREQLQVWGQRNNIAVIVQQSGDAAAVIFDAVNAARSRGSDIVLADTAGRPADAASPDGGNQEGEARDCQGGAGRAA